MVLNVITMLFGFIKAKVNPVSFSRRNMDGSTVTFFQNAAIDSQGKDIGKYTTE
jgi:hypothetical protein